MPRRSRSGTIHRHRQERGPSNPAPAFTPKFLPMSAAVRIVSGIAKHLFKFKSPTGSTRDLIEEAVRRGHELDRSGELAIDLILECERAASRHNPRPRPETISRKRQRQNTGSWIGAAHSCRAVPRPSAALASRSPLQRLRLAIVPFGLGAEFLARQNRRPPPSSAHRSGPLVPHGCWRGSPGFFQPLPEGPTA
jgi:hypothetical protein